MRMLLAAAAACLLFAPSARAAARPFAEYEPVGILVMSAGFDYQSETAKTTILTHLPPGVRALVYSTHDYERETFRHSMSGRDAAVEHLSLPLAGQALWSRDSLPYPVIDAGGLVLAAASYAQQFAPNELLAAYLKVPTRKHGHFFEHGNLTANRAGDCVTVQDNFAGIMPDAAFSSAYGCKTLLRLPFIAGIGHVDEVAKFVADDLVLTDQPQFEARLKEKGWRVALLPKAELPEALARRGVFPQRSYVNSVLVNGTAFVPTFGLPTDAPAQDAYRALGLTVVPVEAAYLSDYGGGGLHCMTMTYPDPNGLPGS
ncbi:MAG: agmatine deiminase family protein [Elusimicrobia bacterium]|nr:agmatine deiminase family protein [Elusimicrobiota bacterium]